MSGYLLGLSQQQEHSRFASKVVNDPLAVIYNQGQWRISKVSALNDLQYSVVKLKQYASKIKQAVVSVVNSNSSTKYAVAVEAEPYLKYSEDDSDALVITVGANQTESKTKPKIVYEAILLSWGVRDVVPNATHLPYLLERGEQKISNAVKSSLGMIFDCKITQFTFTQHHLLQFAFNFIEAETSNFNKPMGFTFTTPETSVKDKLTIHFEIGDVVMLWNGVKEEATRKSDQSDLVNLTYQTLQNQIFYMFVLDITTLDLCEVNMPRASVKNNGMLKMKTPEMVNCAFTILNEIGTGNAVRWH